MITYTELQIKENTDNMRQELDGLYKLIRLGARPSCENCNKKNCYKCDNCSEWKLKGF